jgi:hypothetical protein
VAAYRTLLGDCILRKQVVQDVWPREAAVTLQGELLIEENGHGPQWGARDLSTPFEHQDKVLRTGIRA